MKINFKKMEQESRWKCGDCGKTYTTEELIGLNKTKAVETDTNPKKQHGFNSVCECGYIFHQDKWRLQEDVVFTINNSLFIKGFVSSVFLELNHFGDWYETMIFLNNSEWDCDYQKRYVTIVEARKGHRELLRKIKNNEYKLDRKKKEIILN